jgi:hypothetical protein
MAVCESDNVPLYWYLILQDDVGNSMFPNEMFMKLNSGKDVRTI